MRYIVIDRKKLNPWALERIIDLEDMGFIDDEESLAKFKEAWQDGFDSGWQDGFDGFDEPKNEDLYWNEFKDKL